MVIDYEKIAILLSLNAQIVERNDLEKINTIKMVNFLKSRGWHSKGLLGKTLGEVYVHPENPFYDCVVFHDKKNTNYFNMMKRNMRNIELSHKISQLVVFVEVI